MLSPCRSPVPRSLVKPRGSPAGAILRWRQPASDSGVLGSTFCSGIVSLAKFPIRRSARSGGPTVAVWRSPDRRVYHLVWLSTPAQNMPSRTSVPNIIRFDHATSAERHAALPTRCWHPRSRELGSPRRSRPNPGRARLAASRAAPSTILRGQVGDGLVSADNAGSTTVPRIQRDERRITPFGRSIATALTRLLSALFKGTRRGRLR
jgi:hypothetical protein